MIVESSLKGYLALYKFLIVVESKVIPSLSLGSSFSILAFETVLGVISNNFEYAFFNLAYSSIKKSKLSLLLGCKSTDNLSYAS